MNMELLKQKTEKHENKINIREVYFNEELKGVLNKNEFATEVQKIHREIEKYLGKNKNTATYNFRIYSDRKKYEDYLRTSFPEKPEEDYIDNDMYFVHDKEKNSYFIGKFMKLGVDPSDPRIQEYLKKTNISLDEAEEQLKKNYKNNIYPTIAHEIAHSHSFFKGFDHRISKSKWDQEMVCVFIDQKMWEKYVSSYGKMIRSKAEKQVRNKNLYNEIIKDFKEGDFHIEDWERLFYPFLENRYGIEKLRNFWSSLSESKQKNDFEKCFEIIFGEKLEDAMFLFREKMMK